MAADPLEGLELLPADDEGLAPDADLQAAADSALENVPQVAVPDAVEPLGRSWMWDRDLGRFRRDGLAPKEVRGRDALAQWADAALHTARFAHPIFDANFGMEEPDDIIGQAADVIERTSDWGERLKEALMLHDRVVSVENFTAVYDQSNGILYVQSLDVFTDEEDEGALRFGDFTIGSLQG